MWICRLPRSDVFEGSHRLPMLNDFLLVLMLWFNSFWRHAEITVIHVVGTSQVDLQVHFLKVSFVVRWPIVRKSHGLAVDGLKLVESEWGTTLVARRVAQQSLRRL